MRGIHPYTMAHHGIIFFLKLIEFQQMKDCLCRLAVCVNNFISKKYYNNTSFYFLYSIILF